MLRVLSLVVSIVTLGSLAVIVAGYLSAPGYQSSVVTQVSFTAELTWSELIDISSIPQRKNDVVSVDVVDEYGKLIAWKENLKNGGYRIYRMNQRIENQRLVVELTESSYGLTGIWTFDLEKDSQGTKVTITEDSQLTDIKTRGYRYFFGRNHDLLVWVKYIKVGLTNQLLTTP